MASTLETALAASLIVLLGDWHYTQIKRNQLSWDEIVSTLHATDWNFEDMRSLREMFNNALLLVQLADRSAEYRGSNASLLDELRRHAFAIRLFALSALVKHSLGCTKME